MACAPRRLLDERWRLEKARARARDSLLCPLGRACANGLGCGVATCRPARNAAVCIVRTGRSVSDIIFSLFKIIAGDLGHEALKRVLKRASCSRRPTRDARRELERSIMILAARGLPFQLALARPGWPSRARALAHHCASKVRSDNFRRRDQSRIVQRPARDGAWWVHEAALDVRRVQPRCVERALRQHVSRLCLAASCQIEDEIIGEGESRQLGRSCGHTHTHLGRFGITSSNSATLTVRLGG